MNKTDSRRIAKTITHEQLSAMFEVAKNDIKDWGQISNVNPCLDKGAAWNILYPALGSGLTSRSAIAANMIWEFGDYLPEELKIKKPVKKKFGGNVLRELPVF